MAHHATFFEYPTIWDILLSLEPLFSNIRRFACSLPTGALWCNALNCGYATPRRLVTGARPANRRIFEKSGSKNGQKPQIVGYSNFLPQKPPEAHYGLADERRIFRQGNSIHELDFSDKNDLERFYEQAFFSKLRIVLIENAFDALQYDRERKYVIDQDFLEFW